MAFADLSPLTQDVLMIQFEFFGKIFLIGFFLVVAIMFIYDNKKKRNEQQDTPYILVALVRTWLYALSWIYIYFTPLFIVWLYPQQSLDTVLGGTFAFYRYATLLIGIIIFVNLMFYAPLILAKLGGLNIYSKNTNKVMDAWLGKYKSLFKESPFKK